MAYIYQKTASQLYLDLQNRFKDIGISSETPDSFVNILNEFITDELYTLSGEFNSKLGEYSLYTAEGEALDRLADETYGMQRFGQAKASISQGILFGNTSNSPVTIEAGTLLSTGNVFNESETVYETTEPVTVAPGATGLTSAVAVQSGFEHNVDKDALSNHNLGNSSITVRNLYAVVNGRDVETDTNFRARLLSYLPSATSNNLEWLRLNLLEVPGVLNIKFIQGYNGLGTMGVFATTAGNKTNNELQRLIESRIQEIRTPGDKIVYNKGFTRRFDITIDLVNDRSYSATEIDQLKFSIRSLIGEEFVRAKTRNTVNFNTIETRILSSLRSRFAFVNNSGSNSIFRQIIASVTTSEDDLNRPIQNINTNNGLSFNIAADEIPELGSITINVRLTL